MRHTGKGQTEAAQETVLLPHRGGFGSVLDLVP